MVISVSFFPLQIPLLSFSLILLSILLSAILLLSHSLTLLIKPLDVDSVASVPSILVNLDLALSSPSDIFSPRPFSPFFFCFFVVLNVSLEADYNASNVLSPPAFALAILLLNSTAFIGAKVPSSAALST